MSASWPHSILDLTLRRAGERGITTTVPAQGDLEAPPYAAGRVDAAYLVATLGEGQDQDAAVRELRRVLKPHGRLIVGACPVRTWSPAMPCAPWGSAAGAPAR